MVLKMTFNCSSYSHVFEGVRRSVSMLVVVEEQIILVLLMLSFVYLSVNKPCTELHV
jgi:hypothetical protein